MKKPVFIGAGCAIVTPFKGINNAEVDFDKLGELIEMQIAGHTDAIVICGTTGESSTMPDAEHLSVIEYAVNKVAGRIPVVAGTGSNDTHHGINLSREAVRLGADALLQVTPYYNKATQKGLIKHYSAIAAAVDVPIILYNVPSRTGANILPETMARLAKDQENIAAIKEASGSISQVAKLASLLDGAADIYSGNDDQIVPLCSLGGIGVISVLANVAPRETHDMVMMCLEGRYEEAKNLQLRAIPLVDQLFIEVNPIPVKAALNMQGFNVGSPRLPLTEMTDAHKATLREAMKKFGCL